MVYAKDRQMNFCSAFSEKSVKHSPGFGALVSSGVVDKVCGGQSSW